MMSLSSSRRSVNFEEAAEIEANYYANYGRSKFEEKKNFTVKHYLDLA